MVRVTERATTALQQLLDTNDAPAAAGVRLTPTDRGDLGMTIDEPHPGDEIIRRDQTPVLIVDSVVADRVADLEVDYQSPDDDHQTPGGFILQPL